MTRNKIILLSTIVLIFLSLGLTYYGIKDFNLYAILGLAGTLLSGFASILSLLIKTSKEGAFSKDSWVNLPQTDQDKLNNVIEKVITIPRKIHHLGKITSISVFEETDRGYELILSNSYLSKNGDVSIGIHTSPFSGKYLIT